MTTTNQSHSHPFGKPVNILKFGEGNRIIVDKEALEKSFLHPDVKNRKIVVFSIIGAFRRGKSFFLDYCLRFLYANYSSIESRKNDPQFNKDWIGLPEEPLKGFTWRSGTKRDTTGIIMWSDIFLHTVKTTGEKIAITIMDTQGLFDNETSPADNSRIFALGTLISSVQVLNLVGIIQEDQLQYLQFATEFAKFAAQDNQGSSGKPFQNLLFLIRDWGNPDEYEFGTEGGAQYLKEVLKIKADQKPELKSVRQFISVSFDEYSCCLMPYPGKHVARKKDYDGQWKLMDEEFKDELVVIIEKLLKPENLILKKINSKDLKGFEVKEYIQSYFTLFQSDTLPQAQSIYESTIDKQMNILISKCLESYKLNALKNQDLLEENNLHIFHEMSKSKTLIMFSEEKKMGNAEHARKYKMKLEAEMEKSYNEWKDRSLKSIQQLKEEKKKTEEAMKEKLRLEQEALEAERITREKQAELERQKELQLIENEKYEAEKKAMDSRLEAEKERAKAIEAEREAEKAWRQVLEEKLKNEQLKNQKPPRRRGCTIL
ncbi:CLUMA_CG003750, isoform A [Clunio marinus]|uniref:CLUMA_CG003750, isoform A n=1 Tax=Clunio marinus TaxID=568069 RepID=A0A1J1HV41_9DIPT|nr:CLUMA_CG003750, isoform A [Clunio marinus]